MPRPASDLPDNFALRIKQLRGRLSISQERFAELMGVSFASVNRWENSQSKPSALAWRQILKAEQLGISALIAPEQGVFDNTASYTTESKKGNSIIDFSSEYQKVYAVVEANRLSFGHLFNPSFATETSFIDPLPHQRIAVYENMLPQSRLRFLLA